MSTTLKSLLTGTLLTVGLAIVGTGQAMAASLNATATVTADNHYGLFYGDKAGKSLNLVGRNELGSLGSQGGYNWSTPESFDFKVNAADYLYMVVWDDQSVDESWLGQFKFSNGETLLSKSTDWEYMISKNSNPFSRQVSVAERDQGYLSNGDRFEGNVPKNGELAGEIQIGNWTTAQYRGTNGVGANATNPWGNISGIAQNAEFLNTTTDSRLQAGTSGNTNYTIFRTRKSVAQLTSVPEPSSMLGLLAFGAVSVGSFVKRKSKTA